MKLIIIGAVIGCLIMWATLVYRRLTAMEQNVSSAMNRIGVQLSLRFDAVMALLDIARECTPHESQVVIDTVKSRRREITARSTPQDVMEQEDMIKEALKWVDAVTQQHPEIKADEKYLKAMKAVDSYDKTARTGRLIYNDSVTKLNRELHMFPTSIIGSMLGFDKREYLEDVRECI